MSSGADRLEQLKESIRFYSKHPGANKALWLLILDSLDGCVLLTAEEAEKVREALAAHNSAIRCAEPLTETLAATFSEALHLLSPEEKS